MNIGDKQIHSIHLVKKYLNNLKNSDIDLSKSSQCYFALWSETPGQARLKFPIIMVSKGLENLVR